MRRRLHHGFTLLEVMAAMAILATALVVLLENHGMSLRLSDRSRKVSIAINLAKDLMTDLETEGWPELGVLQGSFDDLYPGLYPDFRWEREVVENNFWDYVRECYIRVYWKDGEAEQKIELTQMISAMDTEQQNLAKEESGDDDTSTGLSGASGTSGSSGTSSSGGKAGTKGGSKSGQ